jgi:co-chaperonin GroES (HSP10)
MVEYLKAYGENLIVSLESQAKKAGAIIMPDSSVTDKAIVVSSSVTGITEGDRVFFLKSSLKKFKFKASDGVEKDYGIVSSKEILALLVKEEI